MSGHPRPPRTPKPRTPACELRRRVSDCYHAYLATLPHAIEPDARTVRLLEDLVAAAAELRDLAKDSLGLI